MTVSEAAFWILRVCGALIAIVWTVVMLRLRAGKPFEGQARVQVFAVASIVVGITAFVASFIPTR
jgi:hypothetical protein